MNSAFIGAVARGDWDAVVALCSPACVEHDHRRLAVLGTTHDAAAWARNFSTLVHLAPDTLYRADHIRVGARGFWGLGTWHGQRDGGRYEIPLAPVVEVDDQQRIVRADLFDGPAKLIQKPPIIYFFRLRFFLAKSPSFLPLNSNAPFIEFKPFVSVKVFSKNADV